MKFEVLICGSDVNAYYMARCVHEAYNKKAYMLIKDKLAYTTHSKIINHIYNDRIWDEGEFVKAVNEFACVNSDAKIVVISSNETYARFLVKNKKVFKENICFNYPDIKIFDTLINKELFYKTYDKSILNFPNTLFVDERFNLDNFSTLTFPVIVKPANVILYNHVDFNGKKKIYKLFTLDELLGVIAQIRNSNYNDVIIVQEYIPGDDSHLFDSVVYCNKNRKVELVSLAQIGLQEHSPNMVGNAAVLINGYNSFNADTTSIVSNIKEFMETIGFVGFAEFDLKYDERDGKFKVLEINARQGRCSYYISAAGYNLAKILVDDLVFSKSNEFQFIDNKVMLSFVNKSIIKKYIKNEKFKNEALRLYHKSINPLKYRKDWTIYRQLLYFKRDKNYRESFENYDW